MMRVREMEKTLSLSEHVWKRNEAHLPQIPRKLGSRD
jgi:hypothetical protein